MIARGGRPSKKKEKQVSCKKHLLGIVACVGESNLCRFRGSLSWDLQSGKVPATARPKKQASNCGQKKGGGTFMGRLELVHALAKARHPQLSGHGSTLASTGNEELRSQRLFKAFFIARCLQGLSQCLRHDGSVWISCILVWIGGMDRPVGS
jgi:hypothetical protein